MADGNGFLESAEISYDSQMPKLLRGRQLRDAYRFAGFVPAATVRGVFGKAQVRVLALRRRQKKRPVAFVAIGTGAFTIRSFAGSATCPVASMTSTWNSLVTACEAAPNHRSNPALARAPRWGRMDWRTGGVDEVTGVVSRRTDAPDDLTLRLANESARLDDRRVPLDSGESDWQPRQQERTGGQPARPVRPCRPPTAQRCRTGSAPRRKTGERAWRAGDGSGTWMLKACPIDGGQMAFDAEGLSNGPHAAGEQPGRRAVVACESTLDGAKTIFAQRLD